MLNITTSKGIPMNVRLVKQGETYGLNKCLTHKETEPLVEFYDARYNFDPEGQFISRYNLSVLNGTSPWANGSIKNGICLHGGVPAWNVDAEAAQKVLAWLETACD